MGLDFYIFILVKLKEVVLKDKYITNKNIEKDRKKKDSALDLELTTRINLGVSEAPGSHPEDKI